MLYSSIGFDKYIISCICHYSTIWNSFIALKMLYASPTHFSLSPTPWTPANLTVSIVLPLPENHVVQNIKFVTFLDWILSVTNIVFGLIAYLFLLWNNTSSYKYTMVVSLPIECNLGCFQVLVIMNKVTINMHKFSLHFGKNLGPWLLIIW